MAIRLFITGGTIDGFDCSDPGRPSLYPHSRMPELLKQARLNEPVSIQTVVFKDGRSLTDADRRTLLEACRRAKETRLLVSHGTSTLVQTALFLSGVGLSKTIVLFGAARPCGEVDSEALFNLGFALSAVQTLPAGVFVAMNGQVFPARRVRKDLKTGKFQSAEG